MKKLTKLTQRGLSLILAVLMCVSVLPVAAFAADEAAHEHNQDGWVCTQADAVETLTCEEAEHTHGAECYAEDGTLTCEQAEHTHDENCYTVVEGAWTCVAPAEEEDTSDEEQTGPAQDADGEQDAGEAQENEEEAAVEETPAEVQAFLDAAAALPEASEVTDENAEDIGAQVNAVLDMWDAMSVENGEREDVTAALETVYAVYVAVLAAEEIEESSTYAAGTSAVIKSADSAAYPQAERYNVCGDDWSENWAETGYGQIMLANAGDTITDDVFMHYYRGHNGVAYPLDYTNLRVESNSNPGAATASVAQENGHIKVTFTKGSNPGSTTIVVGYTCQNMKTTIGLATDSDWYCAVSGQLVYTVSDGKVSGYQSATPVYRSVEINLDTGVGKLYTGRNWTGSVTTKTLSNGNTVSFGTTFTNSVNASNARGTYNPAEITGVKIGECDQKIALVAGEPVEYQDWNFGDRPDNAGEWPKGVAADITGVSAGTTQVLIQTMCLIPWSTNYYASYQNVQYDMTVDIRVIKTEPTTTDITLTYHDGSLTATQTGPAGEFKVYQPMRENPGYTFKGWAETAGSTTVKWEAGKEYTFTQDTDLYAVWEEDGPEVTYTVTYTDGVSGEIVFPDQGYEGLKEGDKTPGFVGTPTREGYTFMGWTPTVKDTVDPAMADANGNIIYTATWQRLKITSIEKKLVESESEVPDGVDVPGITYPDADGKIIIPNGGSVKLLYKITVTGDAGAKYKVTDTGATVVSGPELSVENTIPEGGKAVIYVTKAFTADDINNAGKVVNTATVTPGKDDESSTSSTETTPAEEETGPESRDKTVTIVKEFIGMNGNTIAADKVPNDFALNYSYTWGGETTTGSLTKSAAEAGTNSNGHPSLTWTLQVPVDKDTSSTNKTPLTITETGYDVDGYTWTKQSGLNASDEKAVSGMYQIDATGNLPTNYIRNYYTKNPVEPEKPTDTELHDLKLGVQIVCDVQDSGHAATAYTLNTPEGMAARSLKTISDVTANTGANKEQYPYTCTVSISTSQQNDYWLTQGMQSGTPKWNEGHKLLDNAQDLSVTLYWDGNAWVNLDAPANGWYYMVIHTMHKPTDPVDPIDPVRTPKIKVEKSNGGFVVDPKTGNATVDYTVKITNVSGFDIYGLRLTDTMKPTVTPSDADMTYTFEDWKVGDTAIAPTKGTPTEMVHELQLLPRETLFKDQQKVILTYTVVIENNGEVDVEVKLYNIAEGASWSMAPASPNPMVSTAVMAVRSAIMPLTSDDDLPDVTDTDPSSATTDPDAPDVKDQDDSTASGSSDGSGAGGKLPAKYAVIYSWTGLPEGAAELPTGSKYPKDASVTVDTKFTSTTTITVGGRTYAFSGWSTEDVDVKDGQFTMPAKSVEIKGEWKDVTPAAYTVEWYVVGEEIPFQTDSTRTGTVGQEVSVLDSDKVVDGYTFDAENTDNVLSATLAESGTVLKLYFTKNPVIDPDPKQAEYTVEWYVVGEEAPLKTAVRSDEVGNTVSATDADKVLEGYTFDAENGSNVLSATLAESGTVLKLYFTKDNTTPDTPSEKITATWLPGYGDNEPIDSKEYDKGTTTVPETDYPANPTRTGYTFAGWGEPVIDPETGNITITATWTPAATPTGPSNPSRPSVNPNPVPVEPEPEIPDEDVPLAELPDEDVPMAALPEEAPAPAAETEIADEDVPLAEVPQTGDRIAVWYAVTALAAAAYAALRLISRKRKA